MHPSELYLLVLDVDADLLSLHEVLDSLDSANVGHISVLLYGYGPGCTNKVLAFCTGCALRSRSKRLTIYGGELLHEIDDELVVQELLAIDSIWETLSAEIQAFHRHNVAVAMGSSPPSI